MEVKTPTSLEVYLDNAATTKVFDLVGKKVKQVMCETFGNPSSKHKKGFEAECEIRCATKILSKSMKCKEKEVLYTSGGTESNNLAIIGSALAHKRRGNHIITTSIEHPSVYEPLGFLEENGYRVTYLPVDKNGKVGKKVLCEALCDDTILVSVMFVNNEIGTTEDVLALSQVIHKFNYEILFHVDASQAYGKYKIIPSRMGIDLMSVSAHKFHGPKGVGFLYCKEGVKINPILFGGGQQKSMRSGTENVPGIAGMAVAAQCIYENHEEKVDKLYDLKEFFIDEVTKKIEGVWVNGYNHETIRETAPHIVSVSFERIKSEVLLHALEEEGIYVSSGSACASNHGVSNTLKAIGIKESLLDSTLRFSFSVDTTKEQLEHTVGTLKELIPILRKYKRM